MSCGEIEPRETAEQSENDRRNNKQDKCFPITAIIIADNGEKSIGSDSRRTRTERAREQRATARTSRNTAANAKRRNGKNIVSDCCDRKRGTSASAQPKDGEKNEKLKKLLCAGCTVCLSHFQLGIRGGKKETRGGKRQAENDVESAVYLFLYARFLVCRSVRSAREPIRSSFCSCSNGNRRQRYECAAGRGLERVCKFIEPESGEKWQR